MAEPRPPRPAPGQTTVCEIKVRSCKGCGYTLDDTGMCSYDCVYDGDHGITNPDTPTWFYAVYRRTDEFLRDEDPVKSS